jgi:hypothetical protein
MTHTPQLLLRMEQEEKSTPKQKESSPYWKTSYTGKFWDAAYRLLDSNEKKCHKCFRVNGELKKPPSDVRSRKKQSEARVTVRPVLIAEPDNPQPRNLRMGCDMCYPGAKEPRYDKKLVAEKMQSMF